LDLPERVGEVMADRRIAAMALVGVVLGACAHGEKSFEKFAAKHADAELLPVEFVKQKESADCGAAALTSVGRFWGLDIEAGSILQERAPADRTLGYSIGELHAASGALGLSSSRLLEAPDYILGVASEGIPVIAPIAKPYERRDIFDYMLASVLSRLVVRAFLDEAPSVNHYVVVLGSDAQFVYLLDPQDGYRAMARSDFVAHWSDLTQKFVPVAGGSVAAFVAYREAPVGAQLEAPAFVDDFAGFEMAAIW
jgi:Peptidase C39 family